MNKLFTISSVLLVALFSHVNLFAQTSLNVASNSVKINGMTFDYSIGEMTLVSTERSSNLIVTQGFLQPNANAKTGDVNPPKTTIGSLSDHLKVYPNPTDNLLFIETAEVFEGEFNYQLFDGAGKVLQTKKEFAKAGTNKFSLNLKSYAAGSYYLLIKKIAADGTSEVVSYKVVKTN